MRVLWDLSVLGNWKKVLKIEKEHIPNEKN